MKFSVVWRPFVSASASPWRLLDERGREVAWANTFLDAQRVRQLSLRSLRAYAYDLLHFARWGAESPPLSQTTESTLLDYARHQLDQQPKPAPAQSRPAGQRPSAPSLCRVPDYAACLHRSPDSSCLKRGDAA